MKTIKSCTSFVLCFVLVLSSMTYIQASDDKTDYGYTAELTQSTEENGFDDVVSNDFNPKLRGMESSSYSRNGSFIVWAKGDKTLYADHSEFSKQLATIKAGEIMNGTTRYGDYVKVSSSKGAGWVYVNNDSGKLMEIESMNQSFKTTVTTSLYTQPFITSKFKTAKKVPAGTYRISKRANYFVYIDDGTYKGWIMTQYKDNGDTMGKVAGLLTSTKGTLTTSNIAGVPLYQKMIPTISDSARPGIQMIPKYVTIHNTGNEARGTNALAHANLQYNGNSSFASWHFQVDKDQIYQSLPMNEVGWHAGDGNTMGNATTIGIEICENSDGDYAQSEKNAALLTARLLYENNLPYTAVRMHRDWSGKNCPKNIIEGTKDTMGWTAFKAMVKSEYNKLLPTMSISSTSSKLLVNETIKLSATLSSDAINKEMIWKSSNSAVASVDQQGNVVAKKVGTSAISVSNAYDQVLTCNVVVVGDEIVLSQKSATIYTGYSLTLKATTYPENEPVVWASSNTNIATITSAGVVTALSPGTTAISASWNGAKATCAITVINPKITISSSATTVYRGYSTVLKATTYPANGKVAWTSSNSAIASVSSNGVVSGKTVGKVIITSTWNGLKASSTVTVSNPQVKLNRSSTSLYKGYTTSIKGTPTPSNAKVTYSSSNTKIATVNTSGVISGKAAGTAYIYATVGSTRVACRVTVSNPKVKLSKSSTSLYRGYTTSLKATPTPSSAKVTWKSSNTRIASVNSRGVISGKAKGTAYIYATVGSTRSTCKVTVKNAIAVKSGRLNTKNITFNRVRSYQLRATISPSNATFKKVYWKSSNTRVATVSSNGKVYAKKRGTATITATTSNGKRITCKIRVY